jgi:hypothetical protein
VKRRSDSVAKQSSAGGVGLRAFEEAPVDRQLKLFRFLDFTKYVSMLDQRAVFFTRANHLADPFEGSHLKSWTGGTQDVDDAERRRDSVLVNCWHANAHESAAMWRIYLKSDEGVAIQATVERLESAFEAAAEGLYVGAVRYLDHELDHDRESAVTGSELGPIFCKRKAFEYEREVRLVKRAGKDRRTGGHYVACDLDRLIERVVVSPAAPSWFADLVRSVTHRYGFDFRIEDSELGREPPSRENSQRGN